MHNAHLLLARSGLKHLQKIDLAGERPADYVGCSGNSFANTSIPEELFTITT